MKTRKRYFEFYLGRTFISLIGYNWTINWITTNERSVRRYQ